MLVSGGEDTCSQEDCIIGFTESLSSFAIILSFWRTSRKLGKFWNLCLTENSKIDTMSMRYVGEITRV